MFQKLRRWLKQADLNAIFQQIGAMLIGLALGLYGYESKLALVPLANQVEKEAKEKKQEAEQGKVSKKQEETIKQKDRKRADDILGIGKVLDDIDREFMKLGNDIGKALEKEFIAAAEELGVRGGTKARLYELQTKGVDPIPDKWTTKENRFFFYRSCHLLEPGSHHQAFTLSFFAQFQSHS